MWFYEQDNQQTGPVSDADLEQLIEEGIVDASTRVWQEGMPDWATLSEVAPEFCPAIPLASPTPEDPAAAPYATPDPANPYQSPHQYGGPRIQRPGQGLATGSMITGIIAVVLNIAGCTCFPGLGTIPGIVAVVLGHVAMRKMKQANDMSCRGQAMTGLITGYIAIGIVAVLVILVGAMFAMEYMSTI